MFFQIPPNAIIEIDLDENCMGTLLTDVCSALVPTKAAEQSEVNKHSMEQHVE